MIPPRIHETRRVIKGHSFRTSIDTRNRGARLVSVANFREHFIVIMFHYKPAILFCMFQFSSATVRNQCALAASSCSQNKAICSNLLRHAHFRIKLFDAFRKLGNRNLSLLFRAQETSHNTCINYNTSYKLWIWAPLKKVFSWTLFADERMIVSMIIQTNMISSRNLECIKL